ncbi:hypothetical protein [Nonomuraea sp. NPDC050310]|uniref:hypothetical protein n=1 Tax=unclassified Nonomuraea TaxID=2593643 RepID=UPI0033EA0570
MSADNQIEEARAEVVAAADQVESRMVDLGAVLAPDAREEAGQLVQDARQSLDEEVGLERLQALGAELRRTARSLPTRTV